MTSRPPALPPRFPAVLIAFALLISSAVGLVVTPDAAAAAERASFVINDPFQARAGYSGKGGIRASSFSVFPCGTEENAHVRVREFSMKVMKNGRTLETTRRQMGMVRVPPGTYQTQTKVRFTYRGRTTTKTKTRTVKVTRKTDSTSVSAAEYRKIRRGMTLAQVRAAVGGRGEIEYGYFFMDALAFDQSVSVEFAGGRVRDKWQIDNSYDWC